MKHLAAGHSYRKLVPNNIHVRARVLCAYESNLFSEPKTRVRQFDDIIYTLRFKTFRTTFPNSVAIIFKFCQSLPETFPKCKFALLARFFIITISIHAAARLVYVSQYILISIQNRIGTTIS